MSIDHWVSLLVVLIPVLLGSGGFIWTLTDRLSQRQKKQTDILKEISSSVQLVKDEVEEHTKSIQDLSDGQERINEDNGKIILELDKIGDESRENMKANLLQQWEIIDAQGYITLDQKTRWDTCYGIYAGRGGNGQIKPLHERIQQMPVLTRKKLFRKRRYS